jgi:hypothetical protein
MADIGKITIHITAKISPTDVSTCNEIFERYLRERPYDLKIVFNNRAGDLPPVWIDVEKEGEEND